MENKDIIERLVKLETLLPLLQNHLEKLVEAIETLRSLEAEASQNKQFRNEFDTKVTKLLTDRLNTIEYDNAIKDTIDKEVKTLLQSKELQETFKTDVKSIVKTELKDVMLGVYIKLSLVVGTIATAVATSIIQGFTNGK